MSQVIKVALPGFNTNTGVGNLVTDSVHPNPKIYTFASPPHAGTIFLAWSTVGLTQANGTTKLIYSFAHHLDYVPTVFASHDFTNGVIERRGTLPFQYGALGMITIDADATNINVKYFSLDLADTTPIPVFNMTIRYYVMVEPGL